MNGIKITLYVLLMMHLLPLVITQALILQYPFKEQKKRIKTILFSTAANILLNGLVLYEILMYSSLDPVEMINFACSYQDISRLAATDIISIVLSVFIGLGIYTCVCKYYKDERVLRFSGGSVIFLVLAAVPIVLGYYFANTGASNIEIIEICRRTSLLESGEDSWSEIGYDMCYVVVVNNGVLTCEMDQVYLSDNMDESQDRMSLSNVVLRPGETYHFYIPSDGSIDIKKAGGSVLYLSDGFGNVVDNVVVPALKRDEIYRSSEDGWQIIALVEEEEEPIAIPAPSFSRESGFYDGAFELVLTADPGTTIYYTTDSSNPTAESMEYTGPIYVYDRSKEPNQYRSIRNVRSNYLNRSFNGERLVDKCFVVRAVAVDGDGNFSDIVTKTYFIDKDKYKDKTVISLVSDPDGLFGDDGIYVTGKAYDEWYLEEYERVGAGGTIYTKDAPVLNFNQRGDEWERESNFEVFENAKLLLSQPVGIRIQGNASRDALLKRFSIYSRNRYSSSEFFDVDLINDVHQHSLFLRQGQSGDLHVISQMIGQDRDLLTTDFIEVDVFLDGEFWYTTYLYEKFDERNIAQKYGLISKNNVVMYRAWKNNEGAGDGKNPFSSIASFIAENDLSVDENYLKYNEILDIQSYIDWYAINAILQNMDYSESSNTLYWHTVISENDREGDSRWRLSLYDNDVGWGNLERLYGDMPYYEADPFKTNGITEWQIYSALRRSELFCKQFVLTFMDLINANFSFENITAILESLDLMEEDYLEFFENRPAYVVPYMAEEFELTGTQETVTISSNVSGAPITLNTISPELKYAGDTRTYSWEGEYFTDYPVTVTANAPNFSHWEVTADGTVEIFEDTTIEVPVVKGGVEIYAVFR